jgi:hypothetical protein
MEVLEQINWKHHHPKEKEVNVKNVAVECIDIQKFLWGLMQVWEISYDEFVEVFKDKSYEVEKKWIQEFELEGLETRDKVCIIDIDGILTYYPDCFYDWIKQNVEDYKKDRIKWEKYKSLYRSSGVKRHLLVNADSVLALAKLKKLGYTIVLLTNRPYIEYKNIVYDTLFWLDSNNVPYDYIFWAKDRKVVTILDKVKKIEFVVDDNEETCKDFRNLGIKAYCTNDLLGIDELKVRCGD